MSEQLPSAGEPSAERTSLTLLGRLRADPRDPAAWREFAGRYGPMIYDWCRRRKLQDADAQDVTQAVMTRFAGRLPEFEYDRSRSLRALLRTLARYAWLDACERSKRAVPADGDSGAWERLQQAEARDDLQRRLDEEFDREALDQAMIRVAGRVHPKTWDAFRLTAVEGVSGADAAARLGMKVTALYVAKSSVLKMLREEIRTLTGDDA
jgi:RNA polymerase sigma-70 factor (ECF subfamily)